MDIFIPSTVDCSLLLFRFFSKQNTTLSIPPFNDISEYTQKWRNRTHYAWLLALSRISTATRPSKVLGPRVTRVSDVHVPPFLPGVPLTETALESGVNEFADKKFPQETGVKTGREAGPTGSDNKPIPEDEGGSRDDRGRWVILFSHTILMLYKRQDMLIWSRSL